MTRFLAPLTALSLLAAFPTVQAADNAAADAKKSAKTRNAEKKAPPPTAKAAKPPEKNPAAGAPQRNRQGVDGQGTEAQGLEKVADTGKEAAKKKSSPPARDVSNWKKSDATAKKPSSSPKQTKPSARQGLEANGTSAQGTR